MLENLLRRLLIPVVVGITACSSPSDNSSGCLVDSDCLSGRYCRKEEGKKYGVCAFHEDIFSGDVSPEVVGCGNNVCEEGENCSNCSLDCGECKSLCQPCEGDYQCGDGSGKDLCLTSYTGSKYAKQEIICGKNCSNLECPMGYICVDVKVLNKENKKQCYPNSKDNTYPPLCPTNKKCDSSTYTPRCNGNELSFCDSELNLIKNTDCSSFGYQCGFIKSKGTFSCFGFSKQNDSCPAYSDCDYNLVDICIAHTTLSFAETYCTIFCDTDTDCPQDSCCKAITSGEKVCNLPKNCTS
ncbi:MAG: hypothetical protein AABX04_02685 [Nanoarchaeota archaeon]